MNRATLKKVLRRIRKIEGKPGESKGTVTKGGKVFKEELGSTKFGREITNMKAKESRKQHLGVVRGEARSQRVWKERESRGKGDKGEWTML